MIRWRTLWGVLPDPALLDWLGWMTYRGFSPSTILRRHKTLRRWIAHVGGAEHLAPDEHTAETMQRWLTSLGVTPQSRKAYAGDLAGYYGWAVRHGRYAVDPTRQLDSIHLPVRRVRPAPTSVVVRSIRDADPMMRRALILAAYAGLRVAEIASLEASDIDPDAEELLVRSGKGDKDRWIPLHPEVTEELAGLRRGPVVRARNGGPYTPDRLSTVASAHLHRYGPWTIHRYRHWFATETYAATNDVRAVQELLGHSSIATTERYLGLPRGRTRAVVRTLPPLPPLTPPPDLVVLDGGDDEQPAAGAA